MAEGIKYLCRDVDRHGNIRTYVRMRNCRKIRIYEAIGTPQFWESYRYAVKGLSEERSLQKDGCFVYVISERARPVKIGICKKPSYRLNGLQVGTHRQLRIRHLFRVPDRRIAAKIEITVHNILHTKRARGEWFNVSAKEAARHIEAVAIANGVIAIQQETRLRRSLDCPTFRR